MGRMIDPKIRSSEWFGSLSFRQKDLWQGLIEVADDQGRLSGHPARVRGLIWSYEEELRTSEVEAELKVIEDSGNIIRYEANGSKYIQITNWHKYQDGATWLGPSEIPAPEGWHDRYRYHGKDNIIYMLNWGVVDDVIHTILPKKLRSELDSKLSPPLPRREDEDDVKDDNDSDTDNDVEKEGDPQGESTPDDKFEQFRLQIEQMTGLPATNDAPKAIREIIAMGAIAGDIQAGYQWLRDHGKLFNYYGRLVGPTRTAMAIRLGSNHSPGKNGNKPDSHSPADFAEYIKQHPELESDE